MTGAERKAEKPYATIYELCLGESTMVDTKPAPGFNDYQVYSRSYQVTRVHGGWLYSRNFAQSSIETFVPDTRPSGEQERANRPRQ